MTNRVNPETLVEMYDALDTVGQDLCQLAEDHAVLEPMLLSEAHNPREEATARMLLEQDRRSRSKTIEQRRNYATASIKGLCYTQDDELIAEAEYLAQFDGDQESMDEASDRLIDYRAIARRLMTNLYEWPVGESTPESRAVTPEPQIMGFDAPRYRINPEVKRIDELGRTWVNLCHPRGVLSASSCEKSSEEIIAEAVGVANLGHGTVTEDESGTVYVEFQDGRNPITFEKGSTLYRFFEGNLWVIRPTNILGSVMDLIHTQDTGQLNGVLSRRSEASEVANAAAGQAGSIWDTFNDQRGNPRPVSVAKRN